MHAVTESELLNQLKQNPFVLAPMAGVTDHPFRSFMRVMGCGPVVTELVSASGLVYDSGRTRTLMSFGEDQRPIGVQIFGENLEHLETAAQIVQDAGADFVDINFGCPVPKVVKKGAGSAVLRDLVYLRDVIHATKRRISIPLTIKVRTGWDEAAKNTLEVAKIAYDEGVTWMAVHGRTRAQGYEGLADWDYMCEVAMRAPLPIIGNGDIASPELAVTRLNSAPFAGVMIGRGALRNPWIFEDARRLLDSQSQQPVRVAADLLECLRLLRDRLEGFYDERLVGIQLRKFAAWYSSGLAESSQFRSRIFALREMAETWIWIEKFFLSQTRQRFQAAMEPGFLMGGHG